MTETLPATHTIQPRVVGDRCAAMPDAEAGTAEIRWRLTESGRQLGATLARLAAGQYVDIHARPDVDLLIVVVTGTAALVNGDSVLPLDAGSLAWLRRGATQSLTAGDHGLTYLTVRRRRPGCISDAGPAPQTLSSETTTI